MVHRKSSEGPLGPGPWRTAWWSGTWQGGLCLSVPLQGSPSQPEAPLRMLVRVYGSSTQRRQSSEPVAQAQSNGLCALHQPRKGSGRARTGAGRGEAEEEAGVSRRHPPAPTIGHGLQGFRLPLAPSPFSRVNLVPKQPSTLKPVEKEVGLGDVSWLHHPFL